MSAILAVLLLMQTHVQASHVAFLLSDKLSVGCPMYIMFGGDAVSKSGHKDMA